MTPKQMIEGQIAEFEMQSETCKLSAGIWERSALDWEVKNPHVADGQLRSALAADIQSKTFTLCAERLRGLLKLKGWE